MLRDKCTKPSHSWERKTKRRKRKEEYRKLIQDVVFNYIRRVHLTQAHKLKETVSVPFFKYGKQKPNTNCIQ
jgi:hypothetical protein